MMMCKSFSIGWTPILRAGMRTYKAPTRSSEGGFGCRSQLKRSNSMGLCKANRGNLMQHWVLCEVLRRVGQQEFKHLLFTCTHSMAPGLFLKLERNKRSTMLGNGSRRNDSVRMRRRG